MSQSPKLPDHLDLECPICGNNITVSIIWETETGEFGTVLSKWPVVNDDPEAVDRHGTCFCPFDKPFIEAIADYYNDGERLDYVLFPPEYHPIKPMPIRKMDIESLEMIYGWLISAENSVFDVQDLVEDTGDRIEREIEAAIDHIALAMTQVERAMHIAHRRKAGDGTTIGLLKELAKEPPPPPPTATLVPPSPVKPFGLLTKTKEQQELFDRGKPKYEPS